MLLKIPALPGVMLCQWVSSLGASEDCNALEMVGISHTVTSMTSQKNLNLQHLWLPINFLNDDMTKRGFNYESVTTCVCELVSGLIKCVFNYAVSCQDCVALVIYE
jgi:hypothetical protein